MVEGVGPQREILDYLHQVAHKHDLMRHIRFGHEVEGASFDEARGRLADSLRSRRDDRSPRARQRRRAVASTGAAGYSRHRDFPGSHVPFGALGSRLRSCRQDCCQHRRRPSAIQYVPEIAKQAKRLHVFQRTPAWCVHKADRAYSRPERWLLRHCPWTHTLDRLRIFWYVEFVASVIQKKSMFHWFSRRPRAPDTRAPAAQERRRSVAARQADTRLPGRLQAPAVLERLVRHADAAERRTRDRGDHGNHAERHRHG
jgi:cation diffusion facilitator CzcD-associated flavoprotein CzcO